MPPPRRSSTAAAATAAANAAANTAAATAAAAAAAEPAAAASTSRTRSGSNNPPRDTAAARSAAASASVDLETATLVVGKEVEDLGNYIELGVAKTKVQDSSKIVFAGGAVMLHMSNIDLACDGMRLAATVAPVAGAPTFQSVMRELQESGTAPGAVGTALYKRKVNLDPVARCLLGLALSRGVLRVTTKGFYILPADTEVAQLDSAAAAAPATSGPAFQEAISRGVAVCMAEQAAALATSAGAAAASSRGGGAGAGGDTSSSSPVVDTDQATFLDMVDHPFTDPEVCVCVCVVIGVCLCVRECVGVDVKCGRCAPN